MLAGGRGSVVLICVCAPTQRRCRLRQQQRQQLKRRQLRLGGLAKRPKNDFARGRREERAREIYANDAVQQAGEGGGACAAPAASLSSFRWVSIGRAKVTTSVALQRGSLFMRDTNSIRSGSSSSGSSCCCCCCRPRFVAATATAAAATTAAAPAAAVAAN